MDKKELRKQLFREFHFWGNAYSEYIVCPYGKSNALLVVGRLQGLVVYANFTGIISFEEYKTLDRYIDVLAHDAIWKD